MTYSYNPAGLWTATHQMTMNSKRDGFTLADFEACAKSAQMKRGRAAAILDEVRAAVETWAACAETARVDDGGNRSAGRIDCRLRLDEHDIAATTSSGLSTATNSH